MTLTNRDKVRLEIGDTNTADALLTDAELDQLLLDRSTLDDLGGTIVNVEAAAADAATAIAAKLSRSFDFGEDGQNFRASQRAAAYRSPLLTYVGGLVRCQWPGLPE